MEQFAVIDDELKSFSACLESLARMVVFTKLDLPIAQRAFSLCKQAFTNRGIKVIAVSSITGQGIEELKRAFYQLVREVKSTQKSAFAAGRQF